MPFGEARTLGFNNQAIAVFDAGNVIINKNGLFMFTSLPPAKGNLVVAFAPISGGTIGGNVYPQGFNFGVWDATGTLKQHFGIDDNGNLYLADANNKTRIYLNPTLAAQLIYNIGGLGSGNLTTSVASAAGTDSAGNPFLAGFTSYGISNQVANLIGAALSFFNQSNPQNIVPQVFGSGNGTAGSGSQLSMGSGKDVAADVASSLVLQSGDTPGNAGKAVARAFFDEMIFGANTGIVTSDTWTNATLAAGFSVGGTTPRFRREPLGVTAPTFLLDGAVNLTAAEAANTTMFTLPVSPTNAHDYITKSTLSGLNPGAGIMPATVHVTNGGQVQIAVNGINGNFVVLDGIRIPLD